MKATHRSTNERVFTIAAIAAAAIALLPAPQAGAQQRETNTPKTAASATQSSAPVKVETGVETGSVVSADGTHIGYRRFGRGPAVVVSHGTHTVAKDWDAFAHLLGRRHAVYVYDRRGRAGSPDVPGKPYTENSEIDDLAAVVKKAGPGAAILGHSFGGGVALAYALRDGFTGRLVVYEPGHSAREKVSRGHVAQIQALLDQKKYEEATEFAFENVGRFPKEEIAALRRSPLWPGMVELNRLYPRELTFLDTLDWTPEELQQGLKCRTWMLMGSLTRTPAGEVSRMAALVDRVPGLTLYPLMGQGHTAYLTDPALLTRVVERCLTDGAPNSAGGAAK